MQTTVKLDSYSSIVIKPVKGAVSLSLMVGCVSMRNQLLTLDQCGALLFGMEQAAAVVAAGGASL